IIKYFISDPNAKHKISTNEVMIYITFLIITNVIAIMLLHHSVMQSLHLLRLNTAAMNQTGTGQIMNLLSNDVICFDQLTMYLNYIWIMLFMGILYLVKKNNNVVVKMYAWEKPFSQIVSVIRKLEIKQIKFSPCVRAAYLAIVVFTERLTVYFTLITFVLMGNNFTADVTYEMSTYFNILQLVVALYFPQGLILLGESIVSFNRLEDFLLMDEVNMRRFSEKTPQLQFKSQKPKEATDTVKQIDIGQLPPTLCNINLTIKPGQLCAVVGAVGSGKSSILHLLLKELNPDTGSVILTQGSSKYNFTGNLSTGYFTNNPNLRISYASQEPWLFGGTVGTIYCSASPMTRLDTYRQADVYLLDNPLSAVDTRVARHLYGKCITEYLHGKTRILVIHQLQFLKRMDHIVILDRGFVKIQGNYNELVQSNKDFIGMLDNLNQAQRKEENMRRVSEMSRRITLTRWISRLSTTSSITHSDTDDSDYVENSPEDEITAYGKVAGRVYREYLHNGGNNFTLSLLLMIFIISQVATIGNDYWLFLGSIFTLNPDGLLSTMDAVYIYTFCIIACIATTLFRNFLFMKVSMNSSSNLHNIMFFKLLQARMSFFYNNPSVKSPIFSYVNATLNGLLTIRSSGTEMEKIMQKRFDELQDRHSGTWYLFLTYAIAFAVVADLIVCLFLACICFSLIPMNKTGKLYLITQQFFVHES
ncbi:Multidrug resistance-associated protein 4, partial [Trachymyrmex cornetzi]